MKALLLSLGLFLCPSLLTLAGSAQPISPRYPKINPVDLPEVGEHSLIVLTPTLLELTLITTKQKDPAPVTQWNFVTADGTFQPPPLSKFEIQVGAKKIEIARVGFKRRPLYAPLATRDLRILNSLYLELATPLLPMERVVVTNPDSSLWNSQIVFEGSADPLRWNPAIHVNQTGYAPGFPKKAMIGYYLGSLGELALKVDESPVGQGRSLINRTTNRPDDLTFRLLRTETGEKVFEGPLRLRSDEGFPFDCYQKVWEADFSQVSAPGEFILQVTGMGVSFPFRINEGVPAAFARTYALGIYHQRCGGDNGFPYTRFIHAACHTNKAEIPGPAIKFLPEVTADYKDERRHTAPQLKDDPSSLYPFVQKGKIDVSGGHHDAGDYSKYTVNSAAFIHYLTFAADNFPGVGGLDNLGLPQSNDGKSDLLQEAKWEADFLAKMQDADGGFYFLVYPKDRKYENNVLPHKGDPQIVWPKNTAVTAAAVAALAQLGSSPRFKKEYPAAANLYLEKAKKGWGFLDKALAEHGKDGSYQKLTHYGHQFLHDDELAWAACEMYLATGDESIHKKLMQFYSPTNGDTRKWGWWRLVEGYGRAARSYAFAAKSGRRSPTDLHPRYLAACQSELQAAAEEHLQRHLDSAYGTSFPRETKQVRTAGWYFSMERAFDMAVAASMDYPANNDRRPLLTAAIIGNMNYEGGCNPLNISFVTGLGWRQQREIVHQYAQNDHRTLPPSGIPLGNLQGGFMWLDHYQQELGALCFPPDGDQHKPYPIYDRWADSFNLSTEFVILDQARALGAASFLMAQTGLANQPLKLISGEIIASTTNKKITATLKVNGLDVSQARITWEARGTKPLFGTVLSYEAKQSGPHWIEVEGVWPDGQRFQAASIVHVP